MVQYDEVLGELRTAYDRGAARREALPKPPWKLAERQSFLELLLAEGANRLLEVGAGTGQDSLFFAGAGLSVVATDLSPAMVGYCRAKGLDARVADVLSMTTTDVGAPASFDAIYTTNCLLHVPDADLPQALSTLAELLRPAGLMYLGVWGGEDFEGSFADDDHEPKRFFAWRTDEQIIEYASRDFTVLDFHTVTTEHHYHYQSLTLRVLPTELRRPLGDAEPQ
jgi:SAM-dependent methyltransferase